jgi:hypothetical protein
LVVFKGLEPGPGSSGPNLKYKTSFEKASKPIDKNKKNRIQIEDNL